jgi:hypothetical protein
MPDDFYDDEPSAESDGRSEAERLAWGDHQLDLAKKALRGMLSRDFGEGRGEFVEPVRIPTPVNPEYPEEMELLELATSEIIVSPGEDIVSMDDIPPPIGKLEYDLYDDEGEKLAKVVENVYELEGFSRELPEGATNVTEVIPGVDPSGRPGEYRNVRGDERSVPRFVPDQPRESPQQGRGFGVGAGRRGTTEQRSRAVQEAVAEATRKFTEDSQRPQGRPGSPTGPQTPLRPSTAASAPEEPAQAPPRTSYGASPAADGPLPEYGGFGSTFYRDPTGGQVDILQAASEAEDAVSNTDEMIIELLRRLTMNQIRHREQLMELLDRADAEDDADEF